MNLNNTSQLDQQINATVRVNIEELTNQIGISTYEVIYFEVTEPNLNQFKEQTAPNTGFSFVAYPSASFFYPVEISSQ